MMMPQPVASATPTGHVRINNRRYRWIPTTTLRSIEITEENHRQNTISKAYWSAIDKANRRSDWDKPIVSRANTENISRRTITTKLSKTEFGKERDNFTGGGKVRRATNSRNHELHKSRLRIQRRRNIY